PKDNHIAAAFQRWNQPFETARAAQRRHQENDEAGDDGRKPVHGFLRGKTPSRTERTRRGSSTDLERTSATKRLDGRSKQSHDNQSVSIAPTSATATVLPFTLASP